MAIALDAPRTGDVSVLDEDPDLGARLAPEDLQLASERARAPVQMLDDETLNRAAARWDGSTVALLVLDGLLLRTLTIGDRSATELVGAGDVLRPWQNDDDAGLVPCHVEWHVLEPTRAAVLDERFAVAIAPWPQIWQALLARATRRTRSLAVATTLSHMNRVDHRLLLLFWHFAERWGRVRPDGVMVRLPLTHETLGALIGARRPSVTSGLSQLARDGVVEPGDRGEWLLTAAARARVDAVRRTDLRAA